MASKGYGVEISDVLTVAVIGGALYLVTKSGVFQGTKKVAQSVGDLTETTVTTTGGIVTETGEQAESLIQSTGSLINEWVNWLPFGKNYNEAVYNAGVWTRQTFEGLF